MPQTKWKTGSGRGLSAFTFGTTVREEAEEVRRSAKKCADKNNSN